MDNYNNRDDDYLSDGPKGVSIASLVLGIIGLVAGWFLPLVGYPAAVVGLISGFYGMDRGGRRIAIAGIALCLIGLIVSVVIGSSGAWDLLQTMRYEEALGSLFNIN